MQILKKLSKTIPLAGFAFFYLFLGGGAVYAQFIPTKFTCLERYISEGVTVITAFIGVVSLFAVVFGGVKYMTSGGDKYKIQDAQGAITGGIIGLVLALLAYLIVNFIFLTFAGEPFIFNPPC